mmetsp:Transcript_8573/g.17446  ORF Transcript_8573/g.17446 Transcript_8573/m.17446 type:complete len:100 (+) Transcript_8573:1780-2079(+)
MASIIYFQSATTLHEPKASEDSTTQSSQTATRTLFSTLLRQREFDLIRERVDVLVGLPEGVCGWRMARHGAAADGGGGGAVALCVVVKRGTFILRGEKA